MSSEARVDFYTQVFGLLCQPAAQVAQGDDVVAFVVHGFRHKQVWHLGRGAVAAQYINIVAGNGSVERSAELFPVREQLVQGARFKDRTGQDMSTDFGAFFNHADADFFTGFGGLLLQAAGGGQTGRAGADDDHVEFHVFAFHRFSPTQGSTVFF